MATRPSRLSANNLARCAISLGPRPSAHVDRNQPQGAGIPAPWDPSPLGSQPAPVRSQRCPRPFPDATEGSRFVRNCSAGAKSQLCYARLPPGQEIGLPGRISLGFHLGRPENRLSGRPWTGWRAHFGTFPIRIRPKSGPEDRSPTRSTMAYHRVGKYDLPLSPLRQKQTHQFGGFRQTFHRLQPGLQTSF